MIYKPRNINLLAEAPGAVLPSPYGDYIVHGGHRLWAAPESPKFTYIPEGSEIKVDKTALKVSLTRQAEIPTGLAKKMEFELNGTSAEVALNHTLTNRGSKPVECAAWAITMLPVGGKAILPLRGRPGSDLLADRQIALWPYSQFSDPRLKITEDELQIDATTNQQIFKIGARCPQGWITYSYKGLTFRKDFSFDTNAKYFDLGCNAEIYTNGKIIEIESLSGLVTLAPGESIRHTESWQISEES